MGFWISYELGFKAESETLLRVQEFLNDGKSGDDIDGSLNALRRRLSLPEGGEADGRDEARIERGCLFIGVWTRCDWLGAYAFIDAVRKMFGDGIRGEFLVDESDLDWEAEPYTSDKVGDIFDTGRHSDDG